MNEIINAANKRLIITMYNIYFSHQIILLGRNRANARYVLLRINESNNMKETSNRCLVIITTTTSAFL